MNQQSKSEWWELSTKNHFSQCKTKSYQWSTKCRNWRLSVSTCTINQIGVNEYAYFVLRGRTQRLSNFSPDVIQICHTLKENEFYSLLLSIEMYNCLEFHLPNYTSEQFLSLFYGRSVLEITVVVVDDLTRLLFSLKISLHISCFMSFFNNA